LLPYYPVVHIKESNLALRFEPHLLKFFQCFDKCYNCHLQDDCCGWGKETVLIGVRIGRRRKRVDG
jgi:hypothetical protein